MTYAARAAPVAVADLDDALDVLREHGLRVSRARRAVLAALLEARGPVTADELAMALAEADRASVYRNLETFEELGLVRHLHLGHGPGLYVLSGAAPAAYAVCERCGRVSTSDAGELRAVRRAVRSAFGIEPRFDHFALVGLCERCRP
jgi:Fur family transcriptional regulator, ferric uptake regulator